MRAPFVLLVFCLLLAPSGFGADPESPPKLELTNLYDAFGRESGMVQDFGFSTLVRYGDSLVLFDAGTSADIFATNLAALGIDPKDIDAAVASHGHHDHIGGFDYLLRENPGIKLYLPPEFFSFGSPIDLPIKGREPEVKQTLPQEHQYFAGEGEVAKIRSTGRFWNANVEYVSEPKEILPGVTLIPTVSELMGTFMKYPPFEEDPRFLGMPELSLSLAGPEGEVLLAGCSHSSIEAIVQKTREVLDRDIDLVMGGFHLLPYDRSTIEDLARRLRDDYGIDSVAPAHCSGHLAFSVFGDIYGERYRFFGLGETLTVP